LFGDQLSPEVKLAVEEAVRKALDEIGGSSLIAVLNNVKPLVAGMVAAEVERHPSRADFADTPPHFPYGPGTAARDEHLGKVQATPSDAFELRSAPSFVEHLGDLFSAMPSGMTITIQQGGVSPC
jgi:hypothetical protein